MGKIDDAVAWALAIAKDNTHGYSRENRGGDPDYDCSSFVSYAWINAGVNVPVSTTLTLPDNFTKNKLFENVTDQVNLSNGAGLRKGDIVRWRRGGSGHVEMISQVSPKIKRVGAHGDYDGKEGDIGNGQKAGREISEENYYNPPWDTVLRYVGPNAGGSSGSSGGGSSGGTTTNTIRYFLIIDPTGMNMRKDANSNSDRIQVIPKGNIISGSTFKSGQGLQWLYTTFEGLSGYVATGPNYTTEVTEQYGESTSGGSGGSGGSDTEDTPPQWADAIEEFNPTAGGSGYSGDKSYIPAYDDYHLNIYEGSNHANAYTIAYNGTMDKDFCITSSTSLFGLNKIPIGTEFYIGIEWSFYPKVLIKQKSISKEGYEVWTTLETLEEIESISGSYENIHSFKITKEYPKNSFIFIHFGRYTETEASSEPGEKLYVFIYSKSASLIEAFSKEDAEITSISFSREQNLKPGGFDNITGVRVTPKSTKSGTHFTSFTGVVTTKISKLLWNLTNKSDHLSTYCHIRNCSSKDLVLKYAIQGLVTDGTAMWRCPKNDDNTTTSGYGYYTVTIKPGETKNIVYCVKNYGNNSSPVAKIYNSTKPNKEEDINFEELFWRFDVLSSPANFIIVDKERKNKLLLSSIFESNSNFAITPIIQNILD